MFLQLSIPKIEQNLGFKNKRLLESAVEELELFRPKGQCIWTSVVGLDDLGGLFQHQ